MNIFVLDQNPEKAAQYHCDKHVVKMVLETAQLLSTAKRELYDEPGDVYKPTHVNHPCAVWVRESYANYVWALMLMLNLGGEYYHRYGRKHKSMEIYCDLAEVWSEDFPSYRLTPFAQAMPEEYRGPDAVAAYRAYYLGEKRDMLQWRNRETPEWVR